MSNTLLRWWEIPEEQKPKWMVRGVDGHNKPVTSPVFIQAQTVDGAVRTGKYAMRVFGIKRRGTIVATRYQPEHDPEFLRGGWIRKTEAIA